MSYYFNKELSTNFENAVEHVKKGLMAEGFGVLTEIDVKETMKKKLDVDFKNYRILGACSPIHAFKALSVEDKIGTMLPCNVVVQELEPGKIEVAAVDPIASMMSVKNVSLGEIALEVQMKLKKVIENL